MPQPKSSIHLSWNFTSNSNDGWVNGKKASTHLVSTSAREQEITCYMQLAKVTQRKYSPSPNRCRTNPVRHDFKFFSKMAAASSVWYSCFTGLRLPFSNKLMLSGSDNSLKSWQISNTVVQINIINIKMEVCNYLMFSVQSHTFSLMENREVGGVNLISAVNITNNNEIVQSHGNEFFLMGACVPSKNVVFIQIITVRNIATRVVLTYQ